MGSTLVYPLLAIVGIVGSSFLWNALLRGKPRFQDRRLVYIYLAALGGAFLGAKVAYLFAEGWTHLANYSENPMGVWRQWLTGKSVTGALLGGYGAVELSKWMTGYRRATGDLFAVIVPLGLVLGRVGCLASGCCLGRPMDVHWYTLVDRAGISRWPAVPVEWGFNALLALLAGVCWRKGWLSGQVFHIYLIAYGLFRFGHEFFRDTPRIAGGISGYQMIAVLIAAFGLWRFIERASNRNATDAQPT